MGVCILLIISFVSNILCSLVNRMDHDLLIANDKNFHSLVISPRANKPTSAFFYKSKDKNIKNLINYTLDVVAKDLKVDCDESSNNKLCNSQLNNNATPQLIVYPMLPQPQYFFKGSLDNKAQITGTLLSHIPSNVQIIPNGGYKLFMANMEIIPKVILVTEKTKPSWIYNALSNSFNNNLIFGFFNSKDHSDVVSKYRIKKFPWLAVIKDNKANIYTGEMKFQPMFDWLNIFSETYISGNDVMSNNADISPKPWKFEQIPKLNYESQHDICLRDTTQGLCVVYVTKNLTPNEKNMLVDISNIFSSKIQGRGVAFRWMWLNSDEEPNFKSKFKITKFPSLIVINPHKRLRYVLLDGNTNNDTITNLLEKIQVGDAKFTTVSDGKMPDFTYKRTEL